MRPVVLPSNRPRDRFYRGGRRITDFRGDPPAGTHEPEDWVASTTAVRGRHPVGLTVLPDGRTLARAVADDPSGWLGAAHVAAWGVDTKLLVKLLDAGQRLPVHAHPDGAFANDHLGSAHGKAEAWFVLRGGPVHLGLVRDVAPGRLRDLVDHQDVAALLGSLHRVEVSPGDVVYVPPGVLHAIGAGVFLVEVQEPEDLSILLEWDGFDLDGTRDGHLGLGFGLALSAVERRARSRSEVDDLVGPAGFGASVLPRSADDHFRFERRSVSTARTVAAGLAVLVVTQGELHAPRWQLDLPRGCTVLLPHAAGPLEVVGDGQVLVCRPPSPG